MSRLIQSRPPMALALLIAIAALPMAARSQVLPPAAYTLGLTDTPGLSSPGTITATLTGPLPSDGSVAVVASAIGTSLAASAQALDPQYASRPAFGAAISQLTYFVGVYGPQGNIPVPVTISASVADSASPGVGSGGGTGAASTYIEWYANNGAHPVGEISVGVSCTTTSCSYSDFTLNVPGLPAEGNSPTLTVVDAPYTINSFANSNTAVNDDNAVEMFAGANGSSGSGIWSASADPVIQIDPTWLAEHPGYRLVISSNITPVPLPGAVWFLMGGLGGLGVLARRMRSA